MICQWVGEEIPGNICIMLGNLSYIIVKIFYATQMIRSLSLHLYTKPYIPIFSRLKRGRNINLLNIYQDIRR